MHVFVSSRQTHFSPSRKCPWDAQLIFVTSAPAALAYFFQAGVQFSTGNARETVLSEVSWDFAKFVDLKYQTDQPKTKYNHPNNKYSPMWNSPVLSQDKFCREFTHFLAYFFQASICAGVRKMTNIRYAHVPWYKLDQSKGWNNNNQKPSLPHSHSEVSNLPKSNCHLSTPFLEKQSFKN